MRIFLLAWNPNRWIWETLSKDIEEIDQTGFMTCAWSVVSDAICQLEVVFLSCGLGANQRGLLGQATL